MNGTNQEVLTSQGWCLETATLGVLETMFFAEGVVVDQHRSHADPVTCMLHSVGAEPGTVSVSIDHQALAALCESFYGDSVDAEQPAELLCEFTNMVAGSALSKYSPSQICPLSSPVQCNFAEHVERLNDLDATVLHLDVEGGALSIAWRLDKK